METRITIEPSILRCPKCGRNFFKSKQLGTEMFEFSHPPEQTRCPERRIVRCAVQSTFL